MATATISAFFVCKRADMAEKSHSANRMPSSAEHALHIKQLCALAMIAADGADAMVTIDLHDAEVLTP